MTGLGAGTSHTLKVAFDGVNTKFKATHTSGIKSKISRAAQISLSINGVIQQPQDTSSPTVGYGVEADSTIVFSTAPVATDKVFGSFIGEVAPSFDLTDNTVDNFTGDGSTTTFTLSRETPSSQDVLITLDGVIQHPSDASTTRSYSVVNQGLSFTSAPADGVAIQARHIGFAGATTSAVTGFYGRTGNVALTSTDDISVQNISAGIITATTFGGNPSFTGNVSIGGTLTYEDVTNIDAVGLITARQGIKIGTGVGVAASISVDGNAEFSGIATVNNELHIPDYIHHVGDNNCKFGFESGDTFAVETAGSERVRITSGGSLLVGKTAGTMATAGTRIDPQTTLITGSSTSTNLATASGAALALINNSATDNNFSNIGGYNSNSLVTSQINFVNTDISSRHGAIAFMVHNGSSMPEMMRITKDGYVGIGKNNPQHPLHLQTSSTAASGPIIGFASTDAGLDQDQVIGGFEFTKSDASGAGGGLCGSIKVRSDDSFGARTYIAFRTRSNTSGSATDTERFRIMAQGGVTFNGDTSYDNALDDYEEGTWTPTSRDGSVTASKAFYTKIGRQVTLHCRLESFTDNSTNDQVTIQGIPFAVVADKSDIAHGSARYQNISETNNTVCFITHGRQGFNFSGGDSGAFSQIRYNELNSNSRIDLIATYFTG
mgnify:CR=1 FL=1